VIAQMAVRSSGRGDDTSRVRLASALDGRARRAAALVAALVLVLLAFPLAARPAGAAVGTVAPPTPDLGPTIDPLQPYDSSEGTTCSTTVQPGVVAVQNLITRAYGAQSFGTLRTCSATSKSGHEEGRSLDWMNNAANAAQKARADEFVAWLLATDKYGNQFAMARRLGVMYIIWNDWMWRSYDVTRRDNPSSNPHTDHIHISFGWPGARAQTSYFTGGYGCSPDTAGCPLTRLGGTERFATAVLVARAAVPESDTVVIASGEQNHLVDGLVAAPLARAHDAPVLLTLGSSVPAVTAAEITRRGASRALVIGGEGAIAASVVDQLAALGVTDVQRFAGADRYGTAAAVARAVGSPSGRAFVASGLNPSLLYALVAGAPGAATQVPVLLVPGDRVPAEVSAALTDLGVSSVRVVSPPAVVPDALLGQLPGATRVAGTDVYTVATALATAVGAETGTTEVVLASGNATNIVDALPGGVFGRPVLLTPSTSLSTATRSWLVANPAVESVTVLGGTGAVSDFAARMASLYVSP
jgi:hypothetical protein